MKAWYVLLVILSLLSIGIWSGCRSTAPPEGQKSNEEPPLTVQASADIVIVERGSPRLTLVQPVPAHVLIAPGETAGLSAIAFDQKGIELRSATVNWQVVDAEVGTITPSGVFRAGFTKGTFKDALVVTARPPTGMGTGLVQAAATVTVVEYRGQLQPTGIRVFPGLAELEPKGTLRMVALAVDANGVAIPSMKFKWEMLDKDAGSVSQDGRLTVSENIGTFPRAVQVTLIPGRGQRVEEISTSLDVHVVDPASLDRRISAIILPQVISLRRKEQFRFTTLILDKKGKQITPVEPRWEVLDTTAGVISETGRFTSGEEPAVYPGVVRVSMGIDGVDERVVATATVVIVEVVAPLSPKPEQLAKVVIFPERVVLSPGESTRVSIVGLNGDIRAMSTANVRWSLNPSEVGDVSQFVAVTAHDFPGIYEGAIRAEVTLETESGLVIRDRLARVEITPGVATLARKEKIQFRAVAYDKNGIIPTDVFFR